MIYQLSQVSNRDLHVLYPYRILRHDSSKLSELFRHIDPTVFLLDSPTEVTIDGELWYEYRFKISDVPNHVPYLEFSCTDSDVMALSELTEVEVSGSSITVRGRIPLATSDSTVAIYWVPTLAYIDKLQADIEAILGKIARQSEEDADLIRKLGVSSDYVLNVDGLVPNLVSIGTDDTGYIYDDSHYRIVGSVLPQRISNPPQSLVSSILKSQTGTLVIDDNQNESKVYQGFYGGCMRLSGKFKTLVLQDITSILYLTGVTATTLLISNCPAVIFRNSLTEVESSGLIENLNVRNSYVTVDQPVDVGTINVYKNSTVIQKKGTVNKVGFIESGSTLIYSNPSDDNQIEEVGTSALQGLFYTENAPEGKEYLDEIFLAQKPISFQRGQVEDPLPATQADVNIYLKHSSSPSPAPGPGGKTYSPFTDWYWSGDSRTVQLIAATGTDGKGYGGESLPKLLEVKSEIETEGAQHNIMLWWGVNGLDYGATAYAEVYMDIAHDVGSNAKVFVGTVGHCPNGTGSGKCDGGAGQDLGPFNKQIEEFNEDLVTALARVADVVVLDVAGYIHELEETHGAAWLTNDNLHYKPEASRAIYDWVCDQITNVEPGTIPDAPTDTHAGVIWNWFKNANIPNVSNRPELIAGIIGNCQQESYAAIDVLGCNNGFYGPWCESDAGFRNYLTSNGFTFHPYTATPGNQSAAIPFAFTWLTQQSTSWVNWLYRVIDQVQNQTGEAGARAYAELFCVCVERCINGGYSVEDPGVYQIMRNYYGGTVYTYQHLNNRRDNAAAIYRRFMNIS